MANRAVRTSADGVSSGVLRDARDTQSGESLRASHWVKGAALTTLEAPTLKRCWWMVQEEASNTTTLPSFRAHHNLGCASSTFSAGSRRPEEESSPETFQSDQ